MNEDEIDDWDESEDTKEAEGERDVFVDNASCCKRVRQTEASPSFSINSS